MDKYEAKAVALRSRIASVLRALDGLNLRKSDFMPAPDSENNCTFLDIVLDVQLLFYCYDPGLPLYARSLALNKRVESIKSTEEDYARYEDFKDLENLIDKFLNVLEFRQQP